MADRFGFKGLNMPQSNAPSDLSSKTVVVLSPTYNDWQLVRSLLPMIDDELKPLGVTGRVVIVDDGSTSPEGRDGIAELFAARMSIAAFGLLLFVIVVSLGLIGPKIFTNIPLVGWTSTIISTAVITLFLVLNMRTQIQAIPLQVHSRFILSFERHYGASLNQQS